MIKKKKRTNVHKYCRECGRIIWPTLIGAEKYVEYSWGDATHPYRKFSQETGQRQYVRKYKCQKANLINKHDDYMTEKIYT